MNNGTNIPREMVYEVLSGLANNASTIANYRFYCYLVANTILVLAWVELYKIYLGLSTPLQSNKWEIVTCIFAFVVSGFGAWLGYTFGRFLKRTKLYELHYIGWAAQMEIDKEYLPHPYLWTGLIREFAEDIINLDNSINFLRRKALLEMIKNKFQIKNTSNKVLVRSKHILPSEIRSENNSEKLYFKDSKHDEIIESKLGTSNIPQGTAYNLFRVVPAVFMVFFGITTFFSFVLFLMSLV